jgi:hypothetical protein
MSKQSITGYVDKAIQNKGGFFAICVDDTWYGTGKEDTRDLEGQTVTFEASKRGQYWDAKAIVKAAAPAGSSGKGGGVPAGDRQKSIVMQSSYKTATELVTSLIAADKLTLGGKKADALDTALGLVEEAALHIFGNCIDPEAFLEEAHGPVMEEAAPPENYSAMDA